MPQQLLPSTHIPIKWYCDENLALKEIKALEKYPFYLGSTFAIPDIGDYLVSEPTFKNYALIHGEKGINAVSNICRHRQSILLENHGNKKTITCPVHYWKYALDGTGISAYHFDSAYQCPNLPTIPLTRWGPLLFKENGTIQHILDRATSLKKLREGDYLFCGIEVVECDYNWKIFMETFLDLYHINVIHPGLRKFASCENTEWEIDDFFSSQTVDIILQPNKNPSSHYARYSKLIMDYTKNQMPQKITWFSVYPNTMVEFYPYNLVLTNIIPISASKSLNVIEFYMDADLKSYEYGQAMHQAFKDSYLETAREDDIACQQIQKGRDLLFKMNQEDHGPCHDPLEIGIPSFYHYWNHYFQPENYAP